MVSYAARLDKFIAQQLGCKKRHVQLLLAQGQVLLNGEVCHDGESLIGQFCSVQVAANVLRQQTPIYLMLHKPAGVLSATEDKQHTTVMDLLPPKYSGLHIAGRLDRQSTGLLLLTNDGQWSRQITQPATKLNKYYSVTVAKPITQTQVDAFEQGIYFAYEDLTTAPAQLIVTGICSAQVVLSEGRYHQIKRMFGHFRNQVLSIHRSQIGHIKLPVSLAAGHYIAVSDPMDF